jgi:glucosylceramidase
MRVVIDLNRESPSQCGSSRRAFLRRAAASSVFALSPRWLRSQYTAHRPPALYVTDAMEKYAERPGLQWSGAAARGRGATIEIDSTLEYQPILGFGAALTEASCFLLHGMPTAARQAFLAAAYSPLGLNLNLGRSCIGSSDYSRSVYCYDDVPDDMNLDHFTLKHDEACVLPTLREIRQINPRLFLMATPWSPPGWMKTYGSTFGGRTTENILGPYTHSLWDMANESMLGGWMSDQHLGVYSRYIEKFLQGYARAGAPVQAISCQNEVETTQNGKMPACRWSPGLEAAFVRDHLGPSLRAQHLETQIWLLDHNYSYYQRVASQLEDQQLARYVDGVAWHGYAGTPDQMSLLHRKKPSIPFHWTEGGPFIDDPNYGRDWAKWGGIFTDALENWCRSVITWNLMLDPKGRPNVGPYTCGGLVTLNDDGSIWQSGQCHALRHFSRHLQRDGVRIASGGNASGLRHLAVRNPDGGFAVVLTNPGEAMDLRVVHAGQQVSLSLPRDAVATLAWS